jgi:hypothetical protein
MRLLDLTVNKPMKALIRVIRKTEYASIVEMTPQKYERLQHNFGSRFRGIRDGAEKELNKLIDVKDWQSDDLDSVEEFNEWKDTDSTPSASEV